MPGILRDIEKKLEGFFTDLFGKAFRSGIQPIEVARKLLWEMDSNKRVGVSAVYAPNRYVVLFSVADREKLAGVEEEVVTEMRKYLKEHAAKSGYRTSGGLQLVFETDPELGLGEFGIATEYVQDPADVSQSLEMKTMVYSPPPEPDEEKPAPLRSRMAVKSRALLRVKGKGGRKVIITGDRVGIGRSRDNGLVIDDSKTSRNHGEVVRDDFGRFEYHDLGSTNGSMLNGVPIQSAVLSDGDVLTIGLTEVSFAQEVDR